MILYPQFFAPIHQFALAAQQGKLKLYKDPYFTKQSKANQMRVSGPNSIQLISLNINRNTLKVPLDQVQLSPQKDWRIKHLKTIESAYRKAPFYQYYDYKFEPLFQYTSLYKAINDSYVLCLKALDFDIRVEWTEEKPGLDPKNLVLKEYEQVFSDRHGFLPDLSILDLIYNQGPMARDILITND